MMMAKLAERGTGSASTQAVVTGPSHPIVNGLTGTQTLSGLAGLQDWGTPSQFGTKVLTYPGAGNQAKATLFTYETGANMATEDPPPALGPEAPARRVMWGFYHPMSFTLTGTGGNVFDRMIFWATNTAIPLTVDAGPDRSLVEDVAEAGVILDGTVLDDGLPNPPGVVSKTWTQLSGPDTVTFVTTPLAEDVTVTFPTTGTYVLRLEGDDGESIVSDEVTVVVFPEGSNAAPIVNAGPDMAVERPNAVALVGSVIDDGQPNPPGALTYSWTQQPLPGGGVATFAYPTSISTTATFTQNGTYVLRLTASDGAFSAYDDVVVTVNASALLVVGDANPLSPGDALLKSRIEQLGFPVVTMVAPDVAIATTTGKAFIWMSSTVPNYPDGESLVDNVLSNRPVPVGIQSTGVADNMGMVPVFTGGTAPSQTQGVIASPNHAIAAGLSGTVLLNTTAANHAWGTPAASAVKLVTVPADANQVSVYAYGQGAIMASGSAALARRVFFGPSDLAVATLGSSGRRLLDASLNWLAGQNAAPWANAGPDQTAILTGSQVLLNLNGSVGDDGLPTPPALLATWTAVKAPGPVTFGPPQATTTATFTAAGDYVLQLKASDGLLSSTDLVFVNILPTAPNSAPLVSGGPDLSVRLPAKAFLYAAASDDGQPGALSFSWTKVSGPAGAVTFSPANAATTTATFPNTAGVYVLRVTVTDGSLSASDDVEVTVAASLPALLVVGMASLAADDLALENRLKLLGFAVTVKVAFPTNDPNRVTVGDATGKAIVVINSSSLSGYIGTMFRDVTIPVLCLEWALYDDMNMTGTGNNLGQVTAAQATITAPSHPIAAYFTGVVNTHFVPDPLVQPSIGYGVPAAGAVAVAEFPDTPFSFNRALVFAYAKGVPMVGGGLAPARRVGFFDGADAFTPDAFAMFDGAVKWLTEKSAPSMLVVGSTSSLTSSDQALRSRLNALGYPVTLAASSATFPAPSTTANAVVLVAPSANVTSLGTKLRNLAVPVIVATAGSYGNMGFTGTVSGTSFGILAGQTQIANVESTHPLSAHLPGTRTVLTAADNFNWGIPASTGSKVATLVGDPNKATAFAYEAGATMSQSVTALERRAGLWLGASSAQNLTTDGKALLDAAIEWAVESDGDRDGLGFADEIVLLTNTTDADTNDDGILDGVAVDSGVSPTNPDIDGDGLTNALEATKGTNPFRADTDGDGVNDLTDCFPLDKTRSTCPASTPGDSSPPLITLTEPTNATLTGVTGGPTMTLNATNVSPGATVQVQVWNGPGNTRDWVGLHTTAAPDTTYIAWKYLNGLTTPPATGMTSATLTFTMPTTPGTYNFRFFQNNTYTKLATSATVTVQ